MNRAVALVWGVAAIVIGYLALSIAAGPKADVSGWVMAAGFAIAATVCGWRAWAEWRAPEATPRHYAPPQTMQQQTPGNEAPGAWRGPSIPLETQIAALKDAGLSMHPERTIDELLTSWPRADYESDPYNLILFMYGGEVEAEPWGRHFCDRGFNLDMECLAEAGDYVRALTEVARITGRQHLVSGMSDNFDIEAETAEIKYTLQGRQRALKAKVDNDWADPEAVAAFMRDLETAIGDGRRFWAADNGQASVLFFVTDAEAAKVNALRHDILVRYAAD